MEIWLLIALTLVSSYLVGAIPFGLIVVWVAKRKDIRTIESGRTGGTNAMRAAGVFAGAVTALLDVLKGVATAWIIQLLIPDAGFWIRVLAALMAIIGHNYSVFLIERKAGGKIYLRGGAGGATALGGAIALWPQIWMYILPMAFLVFIFIGYASITTISIAFSAMIIFIVRAATGMNPWVYVAYGAGALFIVMWALRPNLKRLKEGTERLVGLRAYILKKAKNH